MTTHILFVTHIDTPRTSKRKRRCGRLLYVVLATRCALVKPHRGSSQRHYHRSAQMDFLTSYSTIH